MTDRPPQGYFHRAALQRDPMTPKDSADARREEIERIAEVLHSSQRWCDGTENIDWRTSDQKQDAVLFHSDDAAALYDAGLRATTGLDAARGALEELAADLVQDHRGIPYDVIDRIDAIVASLAATPQEKPAVAERTVAALRNEINNDPKRRARVDALKSAMRCTHHPEDPCENEPSDD